MSKAAAWIVAESLRRIKGRGTVSDSVFEASVKEWVDNIPPRTEPYTLHDLNNRLKQLESAVFAVKPLLDNPYPDDSRFTPYTRFVGPRLEMLRHVLDSMIIEGSTPNQKEQRP